MGYDRRIGDILDHLQASPVLEWCCHLAKLIGFARSYDRIHLVARWRYWAPDVDFERRMRTYDRAS